MSINGNGKRVCKTNGTALSGSFEELTTKEENELATKEENELTTEEENNQQVSENPLENSLVFTSAQPFWEGTLTKTKAILEAFETGSSRTEQVSAAQAFLKFASSTPHLTAHVKTSFEQLQSLLEALPSVTPLVTPLVTPAGAAGAPASEPNCEEMLIQLSPEQQTVIATLEGTLKERLVLMMYNTTVETKLIQAETKLIQAHTKIERYITHFRTYILLVAYAAMKVTQELLALAALSEANETTVSPNVGTNTLKAAVEHLAKSRKVESDLPNFYNPRNTNVIKKAKPLEGVLPLKLATTVPPSQLTRRLQFVDRVLGLYLNNAVFMHHKDCKMPDAEYKKAMRKVTETIYVAATAALRSTELDDKTTIKEILNGLEVGERWAPAADSREVEGTHPWLSLVVRLVGSCVERKCDMMLRKDDRHAFMVFDDATDLGGEEKPGSRGCKGPATLFDQAQDQVLSDSAIHMMVGLNFAGAGVPTHATGFIANMAAIQVEQLRLEGVGTPDAKLVLYKSKPLPLMAKNNFESWKDSAPTPLQKDFTAFGEQLYGNAEATSNDEIPLGIQAICSLMQKRRKDLFGPTVDVVGDELGDVIGTGAFSVVFRSSSNNDHAVKISRHGRCMDIKQEINILRELNDKDCAERRPQSIPEFIHESKITAMFGDVKKELVAMTTGPVGVPLLLAYSLVSSDGKVPAKWVQEVLSHVEKALNFMHSKNIFHRDVKPKNIVVVTTKGVQQAILIDYSIAFQVQGNSDAQKALGFSGTVNYAHRKLFEYYPDKAHTPEAKHDQAGLGLTMAMLVNGCNLPWNPIEGFPATITSAYVKEILDELMEARFESACGVVEKLKGDDDSSGEILELRKNILELLAHDKP
jgi:hypothetical protein